MRRIKRLLKAGANIEAREEHLNKTPLICAAWYGHADICKILIAKGADLEAKDNEGNTALMRAAENLHHSAVKCLISHGADVNAKDNKGENALVLVSRKWHPKLSLKTLRLLVRGGANQLGKALANAEGEAAKLLERAIIDRLERQMGRQGFALFMREFKACIAS
jgi:ankyrin repeat protein